MGKLYYEHLKEFQKRDVLFKRQIKSLKESQERKITIATGNYYSAILFPIILPKFYALQPDIKIKVKIGDNPTCEQAVKMDEVQFSLLLLPQRNSEKNIVSEIIVNEPIYLICRNTLPVLEKINISSSKVGLQSTSIAPNILKKETFYIPPKGYALHTITRQIFNLNGFKPKTINMAPDPQSAINMACMGNGFCIVPGSLLNTPFLSSDMLLFPIGNPQITCPLGVSYKSQSLTKGMSLFLELLKDYYRSRYQN